MGHYPLGSYRTWTGSILPFGLAEKKKIQVDEQMVVACVICLYIVFRSCIVYRFDQKS
jgi:hypothetical protein